MDLWGLTCTPTFGGKKYFLLLVDNFTRYMWVFLLDRKSEIKGSFTTFKASVENSLERKIKTIMNDRGEGILILLL